MFEQSQPLKKGFAMGLPSKPGTYRHRSRHISQSKGYSMRCLAILGPAIIIVAMGALIGLSVYVTGKNMIFYIDTALQRLFQQ